MSNSLCVLVGAGFSRPAGLPLACDINANLNRDNRNCLINLDSGEWKWVDFASINELKFKGNFESIAYGYILNQVIKEYVKIIGGFDDYEDFYQFYLEIIGNSESYSLIVTDAFREFNEDNRIKHDNPNFDAYTFPFRIPNASQARILIEYLIADLLFIRKDWNEIEKEYYPFVNFLNQYSDINIVTLNHDRLMEKILTIMIKCEFSDGFSSNQDFLFSSKNDPLPVFQNDFSKPVCLIKLHGSIDTFKYIFYDVLEGQYYPSGLQYYFKTMNFTDKQRPIIKDPKTGVIIDRFNFNIIPQFISGSKKEEIISSDGMYKDLFDQVSIKLTDASSLLIIGYSYGDEHVNRLIKNALNTNKFKRIININPGTKFPFSYSKVNIENLSGIEKLA